MSIICRDCGFENEDGDEWCGDCRAYIAVGYKGQVSQAAAVAAAPVEEDTAGPDRFARVKEALSVDERSLQAEDDERARVAAEDARLAAQVVADREAAEAAAAARAAEEEAARRMEESRRQQEEAAAAAARAAAELEDLRRRQEEQAAAARRAAEEAAARAEHERAERIRQAEEQARREAEEAARRRAEELAEQERAAEAARQAAAERAEAARQAEVTAEQERVEAQRRVQEAAAAAAAAALRAAEERDAIAAAQAAKEASEAQAAQARAEAAAAAAAAAEEVARARAEAEAARAEAAALRAQAEAESARTERERTEARAAQAAAEEAEAARRRAEEAEETQRRRAEADAEAARLRAEAEAEAAQKRAEAELEAKELEAKAAAARAEAEAARAAKEAAEREIERKRRLEEAARLVHKAAPAGPGATAPGDGTGAAPSGSAAGRRIPEGGNAKGAKDGKDGKGAKDGTAAASVAVGPEARQPKLGEQAPQEQQRRAKAQKTTTRGEINPGDLVCGSCGTGNVPTRKFCRRCGTPLADAKPAKLGFFARWKAKRRLKRQRKAGDRPGRRGGRGGMGGATTGGRVAWFRLNTVLLRAGALLGVLAVLGFGVEPIRSRLQLPNVRQKVIDTIRGTKPVYDPVRPVSATASSSAPGGEAGRLIDLGNNTAWLAAPSASGGVGSTVTVTFAKPFDLARVLLTSGLQGSTEPGKGFVSQPRPSELRVVLDGDEANPVVLPVKDTEKPQQLAVKGKQVTTARFEVTGVYPASDGQGTSVAITELEFFERRKLGDDYETLTAPKFFVSSAQNASALSDDQLDTAWVSDPAQDGVGQGFDIKFDQPTDVARIRIAPGQAEATFSTAPRPREVQLAITCQGRCDPTRQIKLKDEPGFQTFNLNATGVTEIKLLVRSVHGTGNGVAFAEVQVQRKRPKVN